MAGKGIQIVVGAEFNGKDLDRAAAKVRELQREATSSGQKMQQFGTKLSGVGKALTVGLTLPLAAFGAAAVKMSVDFESSMSKIVGLVGIATDEVATMRDGVLDMAGETAKSPQELADALFVVTSAGLRGEEAMSALDNAARASAAGLGDTTAIARALAGAMNAYGADVLDAARATDVIVATARAGNFETSQFAAAIGRVLPFAKQAGASFEDLGGAVALLTRTNGDAAESITQVSALFRAFVVPTAEAQKALAAVGLSAEDMRQRIADDGLPAALQFLDQALGGNREQLGRLLGSSEAASAAFQILGADASELEATFGEVNAAAGITDEAFGAMAETTGFKMEKAMANFKTVLIEVGDMLAPAVQAVADFMTNIMQSMRELPDGAKQAIVVFAGIAAAIGPVLLIAGKLIAAVGSIKLAFVGAGGFAAIAAAVTGPVAIVIAAIAGVIAILVGMWRESETFRNAVKSAFEQVRDAVMGAVDSVRGALEGNADAINILRKAFELLGDFVGNYIIPLYANYLSAVFKGIGIVIGAVVSAVGWLVSSFADALPHMLNFAAEVAGAFGKMVDFVLSGVELMLDGLANALGWVPGIGDAINAARDAVAGFRDSVTSYVSDVQSAYRGAAQGVQSWRDESVSAHRDYEEVALLARGAALGYADAGQRAADSATVAKSSVELLGDVTFSTAEATRQLTSAYETMSAFFSETLAIDRAHTLLQDFREQMDSNTAGFDGMTDAAKENRSSFISWAESQIEAANGLTVPEERLAALKDIQQEARDALREQGVDPKTSGFYQEIKGNVDAAKEAVVDMDTAVTDAEAAGLSVSAAIAKGITEGMSAQDSAINAAGTVGGDTLADGFNTSLGINSPSTVAIEAGRNVATGLTQGLSELDWSVRLGGDIVGRTLITGMITGLNSGSSLLYARVRAIVAAAISAAQSAAGSGGPSTGSGDTTNNARGGLIRGAGGPMADAIPAMLSNGEFVIRAQAVNKFGPEFFESLNMGIDPLRGMEAPQPRRSESSAFIINGGVHVTSAPGERAETSVPRALRRQAFLAGVNG